jgi:hypothetical protein
MHALLQGGERLRREPPPGYRGLLELFGSNAAIASAAGLPTGAEAVAAYRARYPHARPTSLARVRATARRERQSFLRNLQRYARGERRPAAIRGRLDALRRLGIARYRARGGEYGEAATSAELAALLVRRGVTVPAGWSVDLLVSSDERWRGPPGVMFYPDQDFAEAVRLGDWKAAADAFFSAWGAAYGVGPYAEALEVIGLELLVGLDSRRARYGP